MSHFGKNIRKIRKVQKLSQAGLAELFGLTRASIGAYEEGRAEPKIDTILEIANHFNLTLDDIIGKELTVNDLYQFDIFKGDHIHPAIRKNENLSISQKKIKMITEDQLFDDFISQNNWPDNVSSSEFEMPTNLFSGSYLVEIGKFISGKIPLLSINEWLSFDVIEKTELTKDQLLNKEVIALKESSWHVGTVSDISTSSIVITEQENQSNTIPIQIDDVKLLLLVHSIININTLSQRSILARMTSVENQILELKKQLK